MRVDYIVTKEAKDDGWSISDPKMATFDNLSAAVVCKNQWVDDQSNVTITEKPVFSTFAEYEAAEEEAGRKRALAKLSDEDKRYLHLA